LYDIRIVFGAEFILWFGVVLMVEFSKTQERAIRQLNELQKLATNHRLAADGWGEDWQTLIATLLSARTTDKTTIPVAQKLFTRFDSLSKLSNASLSDIEDLIRPVNFYLNKAKYVSNLAKVLVNDYGGRVPHNFDKLVELPGVGRKTANVFLAEFGHDTIGVDTHVTYCSQFLGWTKSKTQASIEGDLKGLFPRKYWGELNWIIVRFGQTYTNRTEKDKILTKIKNLE
jgi:endonuclease-3